MNETLIGQILLNQYRVEAFVASGSMGAVYRVFDLKRNVPLAMKILHAELAEDPSLFKRFQREARALQKLAHPNILPFYGVQQTQGFTFLLVRYIDGMTLKEILRARNYQPYTINQALIYLKALCAALGYAHANQIIHCDVKPGNIMVENGGAIYLSDFGIARRAESNATTYASLGTAAYMSPEQIRGEAVTPATDIYALGVLLFELLAGQRPFRGEETGGTEKSSESATEHIRDLHLHSAPPDPTRLNPDIPPALAQVVLKALSKAGEERYASTQEMLDAACAAAELKVDEIPEMAAPLSEQTRHSAPVPAAPPPDSKSTLVSPPAANMIGRYIVRREVGRGGMATVYAAHDPLFNRDVAIKMLPPELLHDPSFRARFEREAMTVAALEHPAIVPVYDYGEAEGRPYFVMRLMAGGSLAERIAKGPMSLANTVKLLQRIASALDEAHARGIIHRDLKPGNILFDQYNEPYLSDFGIAKLKEGGATLTGENIVGTPAYMSPEQGRGEADLDGRSDIYSLGCILYEMLTGKVPYEASTPMGQVVKHLTATIPNISEKRSDLPPGVQDVINRALAKRRFARYAKASDLAQALAELVSGKELPVTLVDQYETTKPPRTPSGQAPPVVKPPSRPLQTQKPPFGQAEGQTPPSGPSGMMQDKVAGAPRKKSTAWLVWVVIALILTGAIYGGLTYLPELLLPTATQPADLAALSTDVPQPPTDTATVPPASDTPQPTDTTAPTDTPQPTETTVPEATSASAAPAELESTGPVRGGADKIAFVKDNTIWIANLDATEIISLTATAGGFKSELQWTPDRMHVKYIQGKCVNLVDIRDHTMETILCANWAFYLASFEISPDGQYVAITTSDGLFILPYDLNMLRGIKRQDQLLNAQGCLKYTDREIKRVRWSADGKQLASIIISSDMGRNVDLVWVAAITCGQRPVDVDQFPGTRFTMVGYDKTGAIESFGWDGNVNFGLNLDIRVGYGDLYTYNISNSQYAKINPLDNGRCCYRDFTWSPDGQYLLFVYLDANTMRYLQLYYINFGMIGEGESYLPLPFPEDFFPVDPNVASPQPALRPAP